QPDIDERRLHAGEDPAHLAQVDVPEGALRGLSLDVQLGDDPVFDEGDARLADVDVDDEEILCHGKGRSRGGRREGLPRVPQPLNTEASAKGRSPGAPRLVAVSA